MSNDTDIYYMIIVFCVIFGITVITVYSIVSGYDSFCIERGYNSSLNYYLDLSPDDIECCESHRVFSESMGWHEDMNCIHIDVSGEARD